MLNLVKRLVATMNAPDVAVDQRHTAKLYGRFVADLIAKHQNSWGMSDPPIGSSASSSASSPPSTIGGARTTTNTLSEEMHVTNVQSQAQQSDNCAIQALATHHQIEQHPILTSSSSSSSEKIERK